MHIDDRGSSTVYYESQFENQGSSAICINSLVFDEITAITVKSSLFFGDNICLYTTVLPVFHCLGTHVYNLLFPDNYGSDIVMQFI